MWPTDIDQDRLIRALAKKETTSGRDLFPNFEVAFAPSNWTGYVEGRTQKGTGLYCKPGSRQMTDFMKWGPQAACSFGRCQIMYPTARDRGMPDFLPPWALNDEDTELRWVKAHLLWLAGRGHKTVAMFADAWNTGDGRDRNVPEEYVAAVCAAYEALG